MCLRIYLNGDGTGRGTHLSLFFVVMRGPNDALLRWPFNQKVRLSQRLSWDPVLCGGQDGPSGSTQVCPCRGSGAAQSAP